MAEYTGIHDFSGATLNGVAAASIFETTVGATGATYTTLKAAVDAGFTRILVVDDTTEVADIAVPSAGLYIHLLEGVTVDMVANQFTYAANANVTIRGQGTLKWTQGVGTTALFSNSGYTTSIVDIEGITLDNNSTSTGNHLAYEIQRIRNVQFYLPDRALDGITINGVTTEESYLDNVIFIGGGGLCTDGLAVANSNVSLSNIHFTGNFRAGGSWTIMNLAHCTATNINIRTTSTPDIALTLNACSISNIRRIGAPTVAINIFCAGGIAGEALNISNANLVDGDLDLANSDYGHFVNIASEGGFVDGTSTSATYNTLQGCLFNGESTIAGIGNKFSDCSFLGGFGIASTATRTQVAGCEISSSGMPIHGDSNCVTNTIIDGDVLIDGASNTLSNCVINGTVLISAAASGTMLVGCRYDAISDAGTDSITTSSVEF